MRCEIVNFVKLSFTYTKIVNYKAEDFFFTIGKIIRSLLNEVAQIS